jgi:hypothetical protein
VADTIRDLALAPIFFYVVRYSDSLTPSCWKTAF